MKVFNKKINGKEISEIEMYNQQIAYLQKRVDEMTQQQYEQYLKDCCHNEEFWTNEERLIKEDILKNPIDFEPEFVFMYECLLNTLAEQENLLQ